MLIANQLGVARALAEKRKAQTLEQDMAAMQKRYGVGLKVVT